MRKKGKELQYLETEGEQLRSSGWGKLETNYFAQSIFGPCLKEEVLVAVPNGHTQIRGAKLAVTERDAITVQTWITVRTFAQSFFKGAHCVAFGCRHEREVQI